MRPFFLPFTLLMDFKFYFEFNKFFDKKFTEINLNELILHRINVRISLAKKNKFDKKINI